MPVTVPRLVWACASVAKAKTVTARFPIQANALICKRHHSICRRAPPFLAQPDVPASTLPPSEQRRFVRSHKRESAPEYLPFPEPWPNPPASPAPRCRLREDDDASLADLIAAVRAQELEGLVAKRLDSVYEPGARSGAWRKMRLNRSEEFVIGGYTKGGRTFDALVLGRWEGDRLACRTSP